MSVKFDKMLNMQYKHVYIILCHAYYSDPQFFVVIKLFDLEIKSQLLKLDVIVLKGK